MSLRYKIVLLLATLIALFVCLDYTIERFVILPRFDRLERKSARQDMQRCVEAFRHEVEYLDLYCYDWAAWDDTYEYVVKPNKAYEDSNLNFDPSAQILPLAVIFILNNEGKVIWGRVWNFEKHKPMTLREFPMDRWSVDNPLLQHKTTHSSVAGVINTEAGPLAISSRPITTSDDKGPIHGTLVMGRFFDQNSLNDLIRQAGVSFRILLPNDPPPKDFDRFKSIGLIRGQDVLVRADPEGSTVHAYTTIANLSGTPAFHIYSDLPFSWSIHEQGQRGIFYRSISIVLGGALLLLAVVVALRAMVTKPLGALVSHLTGITWREGIQEIIPAERQDEIGVLAKEFNAMLERLAEGQWQWRATEHELRESEGRMRAILDAAPDGIIILNEEGHIESANPAAESMFGRRADEMIGRSINDLVPGLYTAGARLPLAGLVGADADEGGLAHEETGERPDGSAFPLHVRVGELVLNGRKVYTAILRDVSALKRLHEQILRTEHLATIGEMSTAIAHEIKNPLAGISGAMHVLGQEMKPDDPRREIVGEIQTQVLRLDKAVGDLLMFARPWLPERVSCSLEDLLSKVLEALTGHQAFQNVEVAREGSVSHSIFVDKTLIQQVLWNVLVNAAQAMPGGGKVVCSFSADGKWAMLHIRDSGTGIPGDDVERVFQPFYTTKTQGTGLGLSVCRKVMEAHHGAIRVVQTGQEGTDIELKFPLEEHNARTHSRS